MSEPLDIIQVAIDADLAKLPPEEELDRRVNASIMARMGIVEGLGPDFIERNEKRIAELRTAPLSAAKEER